MTLLLGRKADVFLLLLLLFFLVLVRKNSETQAGLKAHQPSGYSVSGRSGMLQDRCKTRLLDAGLMLLLSALSVRLKSSITADPLSKGKSGLRDREREREAGVKGHYRWLHWGTSKAQMSCHFREKGKDARQRSFKCFRWSNSDNLILICPMRAAFTWNIFTELVCVCAQSANSRLRSLLVPRWSWKLHQRDLVCTLPQTRTNF